MNYLLDTHVFLWVLADPGRLSKKALAAIRNPNHAVFISAVTSVEISIKQALGKLEAPEGLEDEIGHRGFQHLPLSYRHGTRMRNLPPYHQDPFDRMLIAQAMEESLTLISHDRKMEKYPVNLLIF